MRATAKKHGNALSAEKVDYIESVFARWNRPQEKDIDPFNATNAEIDFLTECQVLLRHITKLIDGYVNEQLMSTNSKELSKQQLPPIIDDLKDLKDAIICDGSGVVLSTAEKQLIEKQKPPATAGAQIRAGVVKRGRT